MAEADEVAKEAGIPAQPGPGRRKRLLLFGVPVAAALLLGGAAGAYFFLPGGDERAVVADGGGATAAAPPTFYDLPDMLVNLNTSGRQNNYLKLKVALELSDPSAAGRLEAVMPRIIDNFQVYLRELRLADLQGSAGVVRLKEELMTRIQAATGTTAVRDILFKEMLVQ